MSEEVFNINEWLDSLDQPQETNFSINKFHTHFLQIRVDPALIVSPKKQTDPKKKQWKGFALTGRVPSAVKDEIVQFLGNLGEEYVDKGSYKDRTVWKPALMLTTYPNTYLDRDTSGWENLEPRERFYIGRNIYDPVTDKWMKDPNFDEFLESCYRVDEEGNDVSALQARYGKLLWARLDTFADNTFDRDDERTWNRYNSEEYTAADGTQKTAPKYLLKITEVFETKEELEAYMAELGVNGDGEGDDGEVPVGAPSNSIPFPTDWASAMSVEADYWRDTLVKDAFAELEAIKKPFRTNHIENKMLKEWGAEKDSDLHKSLLAIAESISA